MKKLLISSNIETDVSSISAYLQNIFDEIISTDDPLKYLSDINNLVFDMIIIDPQTTSVPLDKITSSFHLDSECISTPVVLISDMNKEKLKLAIMDAGISYYFQKPLDPVFFTYRIARLVNNYRRQKNIDELNTLMQKAMYRLMQLDDENSIRDYILGCVGKYFEADDVAVLHFVNCRAITVKEWQKDETLPKLNLNISIDALGYEYNKYKKGEIVCFPVFDKTKCNEEWQKAFKNKDIHSFFIIPLIAGDELLAIVAVTNYNIEKKDNTANLINTLMLAYINSIKKQNYYEGLKIDPLTGLGRKNQFAELVRRVLREHPQKHETALFMLDISNFKAINSIFGFDEGDKVLKIIADIISKIEGVYCACRVEHDLFCFLMKFDQNTDLKEKFAYMLSQIKQKTALKHIILHCGIYVIENSTDSFESLYTKAAIAHVQNKAESKDPFTFYNHHYDNKLKLQQTLFDSFEDAIKNKEIQLYIQPKYDILKKKFYGGEVLSRWIKDGQIISPGAFIPLLESSGQIRILDHYVLGESVKMIKRWLDLGYEVEPISINISRIHFQDEDLAVEIINQIDKYAVPHHLVEIEITESAFIENQENVKKVSNALIRSGINVMMDDFGSGYSSLNCLKDVNISYLKLDYQFIQPSIDAEKQKIIIDSIVKMANQLNLAVIVEGVETKEQLSLTNALDIDYIQGYYYAKPMPSADYESRTYADGKKVTIKN